MIDADTSNFLDLVKQDLKCIYKDLGYQFSNIREMRTCLLKVWISEALKTF